MLSHKQSIQTHEEAIEKPLMEKPLAKPTRRSRPPGSTTKKWQDIPTRLC